MLHKHLIADVRPQAIPENTVVFGNIRVTVLAPNLFRIEKSATGSFCDQATQSVWFRDMPKVAFDVEQDQVLKITTSACRLTVKPSILRSTVLIDGKEIQLSQVKNLPGAYRSLDNCNGDIYTEKHTTYKIKLEDGIVSRCGVGLLDDSDSLLLGEDGKLRARDSAEEDLYVFAHGKDYRGALRNLFMISGQVPLIPKYAFGNWWSRYHAYTEEEYLHILDALAEKDIPLTVATIDMDWHWSTTLDERKGITASGKNDDFHGGAAGWTGYSWNTDLFPDYKAFLQKIKDRDLKITLNLHPAVGVRYFEDMYEEMATAMGIDPKTEQVVPFDFTSDDFINAYFDILHRPYEKDGVEFWWIDWQQGTQTAMPGLDPLWALNHYHTLDNAQEHLPLILSRYCRIGSHRYPLGFSGDTHITWKSLDYIPYFTAMGTNAGYTWWSHDIGGHMHGYKDDELYMRCVQFGVFSPINRLHCSSQRLVTKEPVYYMNGTGLIASEFLRLRHKMIPFLYSESYKTHEEGSALIEPMYYAYPDGEDAYLAKGQYLFGRHFIVAPITKKGDRHGLSSKKVWLPEGKWTDLFTGDEYTGGKWVEMTRWQDSIPVLAAEGAILPLDGRNHTNGVENPDRLDVMVFNGTGAYTLHEDKGDARMATHFAAEGTEGKQTLTVKASGDLSILPTRTYRLEFRNIRTGTITVQKDGKAIDFEKDGAGDYLVVTLRDASAASEYTVTVTYERNATDFRNERMQYVLMRLEGDYGKLSKFFRAFRPMSDEEGAAHVLACDLFTARQKKRLLEAWYS